MRGPSAPHERVTSGADRAARAREGTAMSLDHTDAHLAAEARYAAERVALYQQRLYAGHGDLRRLAELERVAAGAAQRLARHRAKAGGSGDDGAVS